MRVWIFLLIAATAASLSLRGQDAPATPEQVDAGEPDADEPDADEDGDVPDTGIPDVGADAEPTP